MSEDEIAEQAIELLQSQPWASQRRIHMELSCAGIGGNAQYGPSKSRYIHTAGGDDAVTLRISDHKHGEHPFEILTDYSSDQIKRTLRQYAAACACLPPYDEESARKLSVAEWRAEADDALRDYNRAAIAKLALDILQNDESENDSSVPPSIEELKEFVEDVDARVYGALQHLASMNEYLRTHLHRLDANDTKIFDLKDQCDWTIQYYDELFPFERWSESLSQFECDEFLAELLQVYHDCNARR